MLGWHDICISEFPQLSAAVFVTDCSTAAATAVSIIEWLQWLIPLFQLYLLTSQSFYQSPVHDSSDHFNYFLHVFLILTCLEPSTTTPLPTQCPKDYFGSPPECKCFEDNTAYFGNNEVTGSDNPQPSRASCQRSCQQHPTCMFWTWGKGEPTGPCYLKSARDNVTPGLSSYVSGTKHCRLPEAEGNYWDGCI